MSPRSFVSSMIFACLLAGAVAAGPKVPPGLDGSRDIELRHTKSFGPDLSVRFSEVVEDSRCPADVQCLWAGRATVKVEATAGGRTEPVLLGTEPEARRREALGYSFQLDGIRPEPTSVESTPKDYAITVTVRPLAPR